MLKKLRRKFILINMAMVSTVVILVFTSICIITFQQNLTTVFSAMYDSVESAAEQERYDSFGTIFGAHRAFEELLNSSSDSTSNASSSGDISSTSDNQLDTIGDASNSSDSGSAPSGATPRKLDQFGTSSGSSSSSSSSSSNSSSSSSDGKDGQPRIGSYSSVSTSQVIPVAVYRSSSIAGTELISRSSSASLSSDVLDDAIDAMGDIDDGQGTLNDLGLFYVKETLNSTTYYGFASTSSAGNWQKVVATMILVGLGTLLVFFLLSLVFSRWALKPVDEAWTKQRQFLADASHELKTPLTVILANTDIMLKHPERSIASQEQWLESTQHEALGMQDLVVSMLDLARLDASEATGNAAANVPMEDLNLSDIAFGSLLQFESIAFEKNVELEEEIAEDLHVMGNATQLERLCGTLFDNACKYAPAGSTITAKLELREAMALRNLPDTAYQGDLPKGKAVVLSVNNAGSPIDPDDLPHLFDRFYRSDKARTHESSGNSYGLGLAIAAGTVTSHNGCIMATSNESAGTTFTAVLPHLQ